MLYRT